jgi:hypothetical protein
MRLASLIVLLMSSLALAQSDGGFAPLFNGKDLTGWHAKRGGWYVEDGALAWRKGAGDIWTAEQYGDFVLDLEYKVAKGTNSGVFIRTGNPKDNVQTGIEIQVFDSYGQKPSKHSNGAFYDALAPTKTMDKPAGEWNHMVITANGPKLEVMLNGEKIIDANLDDWKEPGKSPDGTPNKYKNALKDFPRSGYIGFQDHGGTVWFRNVRIKKL